MNPVRNRKLALFGVLVASAIGGLVFSEFALSIAAMKADLHANLSQMQWTLNIYGILVSSTLVLFGRMGDIYGRKKIFLVSLMLLAVAMTMIGFAHNITVVILAEGLNGLSSAIVMPVSQALVINMFSESNRSKAIGLWAAACGTALGLGPIYSGVIIHWLSWRWVFLLNVPAIFISFLVVLFHAKESKSNEAEAHLDWRGALVLGIAVASFVMAIVQAELWSHHVIVLLVVVSILSFVLLFFVESKAKQPIIREDLFKNRAFLLASFSDAILCFFIWADFFLLPLFLQSILGYSSYKTGLIMLLVTIPLVLFSMRSKWFYDRFGPKKLITFGFIFMIISAFFQLFFKVSPSLVMILLAAITFGFAWALIWNPAATKAVSTLPQQHAGIASGTFVTFQEIGGSMGLAITGAVVRRFPTLHIGFSYGMIVLIVASLIGLQAALLMRR